MRASDYDPELEELNRRSTDRLLCAEVFDSAAFAALKDYLCRKAEAVKAEHVISKQLLGCLRGAAEAIRSRAAYVAGAKENLALAAEFDMILDLMLRGEGCGDRSPDQPRIL